MVKRATALVVVALCVVGLGLAAASLAADSAPEDGSGNGTGEGSVGGSIESQDTNIASDPTDTSFLTVIFPAVLVVMVLSMAATLYYDRSAALVVGIFVVAAVALLLVGGSFVDPNGTPTSPNGSGMVPGQAPNNSTGGAQDAPSDDSELPLALFGAVGVVVLLGFGAVVYASRSVDDAAEMLDSDDATGREPDPEDVADAAGRAADRIEGESGAELSNAVYEAYHKMTEAVDVSNPEAATPREFATAAVTAGADPAPVDELTEVFEAVRYDDEDPARYEDQAVSALRAIEADLSGADGATDIGGGDGS